MAEIDMKEKLVLLLKNIDVELPITTAEYLIAGGVTMPEWISVKDRLPDNDTYINVATDGVVAQAYWHNDRFYAFTSIGLATIGGVTHWMPLPQPPKGE